MTTHCDAPTSAPNSMPSDSIATFTTVASRSAGTAPHMSTAARPTRCRSSRSGGGAASGSRSGSRSGARLDAPATLSFVPMRRSLCFRGRSCTARHRRDVPRPALPRPHPPPSRSRYKYNTKPYRLLFQDAVRDASRGRVIPPATARRFPCLRAPPHARAMLTTPPRGILRHSSRQAPTPPQAFPRRRRRLTSGKPIRPELAKKNEAEGKTQNPEIAPTRPPAFRNQA